MQDLFSSLADHVASLSEEGFDALMGARPDVAALLFPDVTSGQEVSTDVASVADALADPDGVAEAVASLARPEIQVLMALEGTTRQAHGARIGVSELSYLVRDSGRLPPHIVRLLSGAVAEVDPGRARDALVGRLVKVARAAAGAAFDQIMAGLADAALVWPEEGGRWRLHDALPELLPARDPSWEGFDPVAPEILLARNVDPEPVAAEAQAAAMAALEHAGTLLRHIAGEPVPLLKSGGVGARETKRLVRVSGLPEQTVRFWMAVAEHAGLLADQDGRLLATVEYDAWAAAEPQQRYMLLFVSWMALPTLVLGPFAPLSAAGKVPAVLSEEFYDGAGHLARTVVLELLADAGGGVVPEPESFAAAVAWQLPLLFGSDAVLERGSEPTTPQAAAADAVASVLAEAALLGAVAHGAATAVVRAAFGGLGAQLADAASGVLTAFSDLLPQTMAQVRIQGDMTVIAAGLPSAAIAGFFDAAADRESAGAATVWRFTDASVRRWLDHGHGADELLEGVARYCIGDIPQALRYLVTDAARRHGLVDVIAARAVIVAANAALGAELAALPALAKLGTRRIADTVLVADASQPEVLHALRFAGYLPSAHDADGILTVPTATAPRALPTQAPWPLVR